MYSGKRKIAYPLLMLIGLCLLLQGSLSAQNILKIGYVDPEGLMLNMDEYKTIQKQLQDALAAKQQELLTKQKEFEQAVAAYQNQSGLLTAEAKQKKEAELGQMQQTLLALENQMQQDLVKEEQKLSAPLFEKVNDAIQAIGKEKSVDVIIRSTALLYADSDQVIDLSRDVATKLGIQIPASSAGN